MKQVKGSIFLGIIICFYFSCSPDLGYLISKKEFTKAELLLLKKLATDSLNVKTYYNGYKLFSDATNPNLNYFIAQRYISKANELYQKIPEGTTFKNQLNQEGIQKNTLELQLKYNCEKTFDFCLQRQRVSLADSFLNTFTSASLTQKIKIEIYRDSLALEAAKSENDIYSAQLFLSKYPNSKFREQALALLDSLSFEQAVQSENPVMLKSYINKFPDSENNESATEQLYKIEFSNAKEQSTLEGLFSFINTYPNAPQIYEARKIIEEIEFEKATERNTIEAFEYFLKNYPESRKAEEAEKSLHFIEFENLSGTLDCDQYRIYLKKYPESSFLKQVKSKLEDCEYSSIIKPGDWNSYFRFITTYPKHFKVREVTDSLVAHASEINDIQILSFLLNQDDRSISAKEKFLSEYAKDGEISTLNQLSGQYPSLLTDKKFQNDLNLATQYRSLQTHLPYDMGKERQYVSFLSKAQHRESGFIALQRIIEKDLLEKNYQGALNQVQNLNQSFQSRKVKNLISILSKNDTKWVQVPSDMVSINSTGSEYSPTFSNKNNQLYYIGRGRIDNSSDEDIYMGLFDGDIWTAENIDYEIKNESTINKNSHIQYANKSLIVTKSNKIYDVDVQREKPVDIRPVNLDLSDFEYVGEACVDEGKNVLFFSGVNYSNTKNTNRISPLLYHGDVLPPSDIYVSVKDDNGLWQKPILLSGNINSRYCEKAPYLSADTKTLYFASDGHGGLGRLDIFKSSRLADHCWDCWSDPENMGMAINSPSSESHFSMSHDQSICAVTRPKSNIQPRHFLTIILAVSDAISAHRLQIYSGKINDFVTRLVNERVEIRVIQPSAFCVDRQADVALYSQDVDQILNKINNYSPFEQYALGESFKSTLSDMNNDIAYPLSTKSIVVITDNQTITCQGRPLNKEMKGIRSFLIQMNTDMNNLKAFDFPIHAKNQPSIKTTDNIIEFEDALQSTFKELQKFFQSKEDSNIYLYRNVVDIE